MKTKFRLKISHKLTLGFAVVLIAVVYAYFSIQSKLEKNEILSSEITVNYTPSVQNVNKFGFLIQNSDALIKSWAIYDTVYNSTAKKQLKGIHNWEYPAIIESLDSLSLKWSTVDKKYYRSLIDTIDALQVEHQKIMDILDSSDKYEDSITSVEVKHILDSSIERKNLAAIEYIDSLRVHSENSLITSHEEIKSNFSNFNKAILLGIISLVLIIILIAFFTALSLIRPIQYIKQIIVSMGGGKLPDEQINTSTDEIGQMGGALNVLITGLREKSKFALEIGKENYDSEFSSHGKEDVLGNSLLMMRSSLIKASEEAETRRVENQERSWTAQGLAEFSEILIEHSESLEDFSNITISRLTKYLKASIGGLFILHNEDKSDVYLELLSFYAYDRHKFVEKTIKIGENLVGQCVLENETIYLTDIPEGYVNINSGLGSDLPRSILIVPLKLNEEIYGVVEIASFYEMEKYQIDFVEKIGETLASTIANIKINLQNAKLLEESNHKSGELALQEEESRKNIEQLQANKQEMIRREEETAGKNRVVEQEYLHKIDLLEKKFIKQERATLDQKVILQNNMNAINSSVGTFEMTLSGDIINVNQKFLEMSGVSLMAIMRKNIEEFVKHSVLSSPEYQRMWQLLKTGTPHSGGHQYFFGNSERWFYETYTPVKDADGKYYKIIVLAHDISKVREMEAAYKQQIDNTI